MIADIHPDPSEAILLALLHAEDIRKNCNPMSRVDMYSAGCINQARTAYQAMYLHFSKNRED